MISQFLGDHLWLNAAMPVLIDAALKGALLVLFAAIAAYLLRNRSAASRHAVWTAAVVGHLAIPVLAFTLPAWRIPILPAAAWMADAPSATTPSPIAAPTPSGADRTTALNAVAADPAGTAGGPSRTANATGESVGSVAQGQASGASTGITSPLSILAAIWLAGVVLVLLRLAVGTWRVGQLAREGARVEDGMWLSLAQQLATRLGVNRPLTLLRGESLAVPVTWGIVYPAVLLPQDADTWPEDRRRFVLVHEMAHVKRFDALTQLLAQFSLALFWFDPLVWIASHRMRVEREHACDDYVLRDGTAPSLYAGELLEMVQSIGTPRHDRAAPAFAALAMARRSEFEGRMLAILDPRLDRHTLNRKGTVMTALIVALLTLPLAALRPFSQATAAAAAPVAPGASDVAASAPSPSAIATVASNSKPATDPSTAPVPGIPATVGAAWACDANGFTSSKSNTTHISHHDEKSDQRLQFVHSSPGKCVEAAIIGMARFSDDETRVISLPAGGFARFREVTGGRDRSVSVTPSANGALQFTAVLDGRATPFNAEMQAWLAQLLPSVLREAGINVPARVARLRAQGGVPAVLREIGEINSTGAKRSHYEELLKNPPLGAGDASRVVTQAGQDLAKSSGDLSAVLQQLPRSAVQSAATRQAIAEALGRIQSSGDKANTLEALAPNADRETLVMLAKAAEALPSSGDKANFLTTTASEYLTPGNESLRNAFFRTAATLQSDGDLNNVLVNAMSYGHANPAVIIQVIATTNELRSSGDISVVLRSLATQRLLTARNPAATLAVIERTHTMASSGDRALVLTTLASQRLLTTSAIRNAYTRAAMALPSDGDRTVVLSAAAANDPLR